MWSGDAAMRHIRHPSLGVRSESLCSEWSIHRSQLMLANFLQWWDARAWVPNVRRWFDLSLYIILRYDVLLIMFADDLPAGVRFWAHARARIMEVWIICLSVCDLFWSDIIHSSPFVFALRSSMQAPKITYWFLIIAAFFDGIKVKLENEPLWLALTPHILCQTRMRSCSRPACICAYAKVQHVLSATHWPPFLSLSSFQSILRFIWSIGSSLWSLLIMLRAAVRQIHRHTPN